MESSKTHRDYIEIIGVTNATGEDARTKAWNDYYFKSYQHAVEGLLAECNGKSVLDVGTSHGNWYKFLKDRGFAKIYGVELDPDRAVLARKCGYTEVFNCDAANLPLETGTLDAAVSNDVFVHILQLEDKRNVIKEVNRVLKPGGIFVLNHAMSVAAGFSKYTIKDHCSYLTLNEFVDLTTNDTGFELLDVKSTYYTKAPHRTGMVKKVASKFITAPFVPSLLFAHDKFVESRVATQRSDAVYLKLRKIE